MTLLFRKGYGCSTSCLNLYGGEMSLVLSLTLYIKIKILNMDRNFLSSSSPTGGAGSPWTDCPGLSPIRFYTSARMETTISLGNSCPCLTTLTVKKKNNQLCCCLNRINFLYFILCPLRLLPRASLRSVWLCILYSPPSGIYELIRFLRASSFPCWAIPAFSASPHCSYVPNH